MADGGPRLPQRGYDVVGLDLDPSVISAARRGAHKQGYSPISWPVGGPDDPYRLQCRVDRKTAAPRAIRAALQETLRVFDDRWDPRVFSFLCSLADGDVQGAHRDYTTEDLARGRAIGGQRCVPGSAIVALEPGTKLRVFEGCFEEQDAKQEVLVDIPPGYALIFRGDLVHSGTAYESNNFRLLGYLHVGDKAPDFVENVLPKVFHCGHSPHIDDDSARIRQHRFYCNFNPKGAANKAKKRLREAGAN